MLSWHFQHADYWFAEFISDVFRTAYHCLPSAVLETEPVLLELAVLLKLGRGVVITVIVPRHSSIRRSNLTPRIPLDQEHTDYFDQHHPPQICDDHAIRYVCSGSATLPSCNKLESSQVVRSIGASMGRRPFPPLLKWMYFYVSIFEVVKYRCERKRFVNTILTKLRLCYTRKNRKTQAKIIYWAC